MRRNAFTSTLAIVALLPLTGCSIFPWGKKKEPEYTAQDSAYMPYETTASAPSAYPDYPAETTYAAPSGGTHTVGKKETLYSIARMHYNGDQSRWKDIYEANRGQISDPNRIRVGQQLVIP